MDKQKRIVIWTSVVLVLIVIGVGAWTTATSPATPSGTKTGALSEAVLPTDWTTGSNTATVSLVEYSDLQCPACGAYHPILKKVLEDNKNVLAFTYRHFPLPQHKNALAAAYAAEAAGAQGKFWEMHDMIFEHQADWSEANTAEATFEDYAATLGLDLARYRADRDSDTIKANVAHDKETGLASGVNATPSFYLNGKKVTTNPRSAEDFTALIKEAQAHE